MTTPPLSRRHWMQTLGVGVGAAALGAMPPAAPAAEKVPPVPVVPPLNRFPRMVQEYFVARVREAEHAGITARAQLKTRENAQEYVAEMRRRIATCFGPFPQKTPLNATVTGTVERDAYAIEKVIFESRPGFLVTANLYLPKAKGPRPGVVGSCGHSDNGKAEPAYQSFAQGLARQGYVVLIFDPIGQGERSQYGHLEAAHRPHLGVGEHLHAGNQQFLVGEFFGSWRAWDGIRALDYLLSRPEVDPKHVGITGNSGGGTMTTWLCGLDQRWTMAAPGCFVTTFRRNLENELPQDTEQCPPRAVALHVDHADFLTALAPKPVIILAKERDFFDVRGAEEAVARLKQIWSLLGAPEKVKLHVGPTAHGYTRENREAMYAWFNNATGLEAPAAEPTLTIEKDQTLWCTPRGQVAELKSRTVFSFTAEKAYQLLAKRAKPRGEALKRAAAERLKVPPRLGVPDYRILRPISGRKYPLAHATPYAVETEPGVFALVYRLCATRLESRPPRTTDRAILYVAHHSADAELRDEPLIAEILKEEPKSTLYACDVRGVGESRPDTCGQDQFLAPYGSDFFYAIHSIMLDRPYAGQKTFDLLRVLDWLRSFGHRDIHLAAKGWGTIPATFAALLDGEVTRVTLKHALTSYRAIAQSEDYRWPLSSLLPNVLPVFDLPDCYDELGDRLRQIEPRGAI